MDNSKKTIAQLRTLCREKNIKGFSGKKKDEILALLSSNSQTHTKPYSLLSKTLTQQISKEIKKNEGIYFTPKSIIQKNIEVVLPHLSNVKNVLEPSCGSCEFIQQLDSVLSNVKITGIEKNKLIFDAIQELKFQNSTETVLADFLTWDAPIQYDLIFGNPPYFVTPKKTVLKEYYDYFDGRPNIFVLFLIKSLRLLSPNGVVSFILPKNFTNCLYYDKLRKHIYENYRIIDIIDCESDDDNFLETKQETIHFIIQKSDEVVHENDEFTIKINEYIIFNTKPKIIKLKELYEGSTTLKEMNYSVHVGNVVWNQCKDILTNDNSKTRLIYSSDIGNEMLLDEKIYANKEKKNYIEKDGSNDVLLVINRGYGVGKYHFNYCILNIEFKYLIENHLIFVKYNGTKTREELVEMYQMIVSSLKQEKTQEFIRLYFGNNAINTTELNCLLPIYL